MTTAEEVRILFDYDAETGILSWRSGSKPSLIGQEAGTITRYGYRQVCVYGKLYLAHRVIWLWVHGVWPEFFMDHINGERSDNRLCNLREATMAENHQNKRTKKRTQTGYMGVTRNASKVPKWTAKVTVDGVIHRLGSFDTPEKAHAAYLKAKSELHKFQPVLRGAL